MEQISNAKALELLNKGDVINSLNAKSLAFWLQKDNPAPVRFPNVSEAIVKWIMDGRVEPLESLTERMWSDCSTGFASEKSSWYEQLTSNQGNAPRN